MHQSLKYCGRIAITLMIALSILSSTHAQVCAAIGTDDPTGCPNAYGANVNQVANDVWSDGSCHYVYAWVNTYGISGKYNDCETSEIVENATFLCPFGDELKRVRDVDVVIVKNGNGRFYALVVYYSEYRNAYYFNVFAYRNLGAWVLEDQHCEILHTLNTGTDLHGIRIDANKNGDFAIVLTDTDNGTLKTVTGGFVLGFPTIDYSNHSTPIDIDVTTSGDIQPDVAITESATVGVADVLYTYKSSADIKVVSASFSQIGGSSTTATGTLEASRTPTTGYTYLTPRIACPNIQNTDWATVWEMHGSTISDVVGIVNESSTIYPSSSGIHNYTDGLGAINATGQYFNNLHPCLTYQDRSQSLAGNSNIQIAWYGDPDNNGQTMISVSCDYRGFIGNNCSNTIYCYEWVSPTPLPELSYGSLAGRHAKQTNICFFNDADGDVYQKDFEWCDFFRQSFNNTIEKQNSKQSSLIIFPNPSNHSVSVQLNVPSEYSLYSIQITSLLGQLIFSSTGNKYRLKHAAESAIGKLPKGVYSVRVTDKHGLLFSEKITRL